MTSTSHTDNSMRLYDDMYESEWTPFVRLDGTMKDVQADAKYLIGIVPILKRQDKYKKIIVNDGDNEKEYRQLLHSKFSPACTGSLIYYGHVHYVVTAAHCFLNPENSKPFPPDDFSVVIHHVHKDNKYKGRITLCQAAYIRYFKRFWMNKRYPINEDIAIMALRINLDQNTIPCTPHLAGTGTVEWEQWHLSKDKKENGAQTQEAKEPEPHDIKHQNDEQITPTLCRIAIL